MSGLKAMFSVDDKIWPWQVSAADYNTRKYCDHFVGDMVLDSSLTQDAKEIRPVLAEKGEIWVLGYWNGLGVGPHEDYRNLVDNALHTQCLYWAVRQELFDIGPDKCFTLQSCFEGGRVFPDCYDDQPITSQVRMVWAGEGHPPKACLDAADIVILGRKENTRWHLVHAIVKANSVKDDYINAQLRRIPRGTGVGNLYVSKSGLGGPVVLHPLEVYTTDSKYQIIGLYKYLAAT